MLRGALRAARGWRRAGAGAARSFLTEAYRCEAAWGARAASPLLRAADPEELYAALEQAHAARGALSPLDLDVFANVAGGEYLDELRDLLHKLRLSAGTGDTLPSTHHAVVRAFLRHARCAELLAVLRDPLLYGVFLDEFAANILMDELLGRQEYEGAATVAGLVMLQEDYSNDITRALALYSAYKYLQQRRATPPAPEPPEDPKGKEKVEEIKIRVKFLRNPYFDDHFDLKDPVLIAGKTLAWLSESSTDNLSLNLQILGWLYYKKYDKLTVATQQLAKNSTPKVYKEVLEIVKDTKDDNEEANKCIEECSHTLSSISTSESLLENDLKILIENAINKRQKNDIQQQEQLFKSWEELRDAKFAEQTKRLDEARRVQALEEKQKYLTTEEQKLWFFENEEKIDLDIEKKKVYYPKKWFGKKKKPKVVDEDYIPPEIIPKRK